MFYLKFFIFVGIFILFLEFGKAQYGISPITGVDFSPAFLKMKPKKNIAHAYYGEDGRCGWYNVTTQKYEQPKLKYPNAFVPADDGNNEYKMDKGRFCLFQFHQIAMQPLCGDEWYSQIKYCAMVDFYQNHEPYPVKLGDYNESDVVLFMVDGCVLCTSDSYSNDTAVKIQIEHAWKGGSKFTSCKQTQHPAELV